MQYREIYSIGKYAIKENMQYRIICSYPHSPQGCWKGWVGACILPCATHRGATRHEAGCSREWLVGGKINISTRLWRRIQMKILETSDTSHTITVYKDQPFEEN